MKSDRDRVVYVDKEHLKKYNVIENVFYYEDFELDDRTKDIYKYFENEFIESYSSLAEQETPISLRQSFRCSLRNRSFLYAT